MSAEIYRVPSAQVKSGKFGSVIQDDGILEHASAGKNGRYVFSEFPPGTKPLALIGMWHEISVWLAQRRNKKIENQISDLPDIYMNMCYYIPGHRYKGLFPLHDAAATVATTAVALGGSAVPKADGTAGRIIAVGKGASKGGGWLKKALGKKKVMKPSLSNHKLYILFSYLPIGNDREKLTKIGSGSVKFGDVLEKIIQDSGNIT